MDNRAKLLKALDERQPVSPVQVWPALVRSVEGNSCTVDIVGTDLAGVAGVNLRADEDAAEGVLLVPRVGSFVYVAAVENALDNLFVCLVSEVDRVEVVIGKASARVDKDSVKAVFDQCQLVLSDRVVLKQGQTVVELAGGKVGVKNAGTSLKALFDDLTQLLQAFQVVTAQGPSTVVFPATLASIAALKTKVNLLLT